MCRNRNVKGQFNKQACAFDRWPITKDHAILEYLFAFASLNKDDMLLDVACGTGAFAIYAAERVKAVRGIDLSDKMIHIAKKNLKQKGINNIEFTCLDVEEIPYRKNIFTTTVCKAAFHHMQRYHSVFSEMVGCTTPGGRICVHDIVRYEDNAVDKYFEELEKAIDPCHNKTLHENEIREVYSANNVRITRYFKNEAEILLDEYIGHAVQDGSGKEKIKKLVIDGLRDSTISNYFIENGDLKFKRGIITVLGEKHEK